MAQSKMKVKLEEELSLIPENYSIHVRIDGKKFKTTDAGPLIMAIRDVVYAMKVQNLGHYPLEFDSHNAHVFIRRHLSSQGDRIKISYGR